MAARRTARAVHTVVVNGRKVAVEAGATLLDAARAAKADVPTLCHHPRFQPKAVCRMCLVEVDGSSKPVPACYTAARDGDVVTTDSPALKEFREADAQFLLARHPNDCMRCEVSGSCRLQTLVRQHQWEDHWPHVDRGGGKHPHELHDFTSPAIARDMDKCIECGLCVDACGPDGQNINVIGFVERSTHTVPVTVFDKPLADTQCISCGQCTWVCPVGALTERAAWHDVLDVLASGRRVTAVQVAPATRVAIGEEFGMAPGTISTGRLVNALRELGFDHVFDTNFAADLTIMEEGSELLQRVRQQTDNASPPPLPLFTSCCPGWVNYVELSRPDLIPHLSTTKSPQQMHGALTKRGPFAAALGPSFADGEEEPFVVSVMPCTAKKDEAVRPDVAGDVDAVLTTRELARMIRARGINFGGLPEDGTFDSPLGESTGAAAIFGASGGVLEAALRTAADLAGIKDPPMDWHALRGSEAGVKVATVPGLGKVAAINGIANATRLLADPHWMAQFIMVEVMACPGGCLGGGGEPKSMDPDILAKRAQGIYNIDAGLANRKSHHNNDVQRLYDTFLGAPLSSTSHELLHTNYAPRHSSRDILRRFLAAVDARDAAAVAALFAPDGTWDPTLRATAHQPASAATLYGRDAIAAFVASHLPPNRHGPKLKRHKLASAHDGFVVHSPAGETSEFHVQLDGDGHIAALSRQHDTHNGVV